MTMTDTEAKARAVIQSIRSTMLSSNLGDNLARAAADELEPAIEREEATEARHAAELRELKERFSEAVEAMFDGLNDAYCPETFMRILLGPFIIPAPDPLESWLHKSGYEGNSVVEQALADLAQNGGKIVWEAGE